jgi:hypothetical protein
MQENQEDFELLFTKNIEDKSFFFSSMQMQSEK